MRDLRIDFFRGLAIYMIFVDHVNGDPLAKLTYRMIGFSDAAELFVFLSGLACGIAYSRKFAREGLAALTWAIVGRVARIYVYYLLSSILMIVLVVSATRHMELRDTLGFAINDPLDAVSSAALLTSPPHLSDILVLYIALTLVVVPLLVLTPIRYRMLALTCSGLIWAACQFFPHYLEPLTHRLFFNPFAWQFLFAIGMVLGIEREDQKTALPVAIRRPWLTTAAWIVVLGALIYRVLAAHSFFNIASLRLDIETAVVMKENLSPLRLIHFLSVAVLVAIYFRQDNPILKWRITKPVIRAGMHSLEVFSLSIVLATMINIFLLIGSPSLGNRLAADIVAFVCLTLTAVALEHRRTLSGGRG